MVSEGGPKKYPCYAENFMMVVMSGKVEMSLKEVYPKTKSQAYSVRKVLNTFTRQQSNRVFSPLV